MTGILEAREKHTHRGHCQACGRLQAHESTGGIAKHGYSVEHGYFSGTCPGSGHGPLEHTHALCDKIQRDLHKDAEEHESAVARAKAGHHNPSIHTHDEDVRDEQGKLKFDSKGRRIQKPVFKNYSDTDSREKDAWHWRMNRRAKMSRDHAHFLADLKKHIHGKPLVPSQHTAEGKKSSAADLKVGDKIHHWGHEWEVKGHSHRSSGFHGREAAHVHLMRKVAPTERNPSGEFHTHVSHAVISRAMNKKKNTNEEVDMDTNESRLSPKEAHDILSKHDAHGDFFTLRSHQVSGLLDDAKAAKYRKSPSAPGSKGRMFHQHLQRLAAHHTVREETLNEADQKAKVEWLHKAETHVRKMGLKEPLSWVVLHHAHGMGKTPEEGAKHYKSELPHHFKEETIPEGRNNEYSANLHLTQSSKSSRKPGHYLMKHGNPMHKDPHASSTAALAAYKALPDTKGVSIHHVKEDLTVVPGPVKTLAELKKSTVVSYIKKASARHDAHTMLANLHQQGGAGHAHYTRSAAKREKGLEMAGRRMRPDDAIGKAIRTHTHIGTSESVVTEDAPAMSSGAAGDPGHVQNATDNYASQKKRIKDMVRRKKPIGEELDTKYATIRADGGGSQEISVGVASPEELEMTFDAVNGALPKKLGPGGVDESADQYTHHHSRASWVARAKKHGYAVSNAHPNGKDLIANHPKHGYHVGSYNHVGQNGWISKPHPDWSK